MHAEIFCVGKLGLQDVWAIIEQVNNGGRNLEIYLFV